MKIRPIIEQYIYEHKGVSIGVRIDYERKEISLVEKDGTNKQWLYVGRGLEYMDGWKLILHAQEKAIDHATKRLKTYVDTETFEFGALVSEAMERINKSK